MLEPDPQAMQALMAEVVRRVSPYLGALSEAQATEGDVEALREPMPVHGMGLSDILDSFWRNALGCSVNTAGPTYQAYIPGGGVFAAAVGEFLAAATNRYVGVYGVAPGPVQIETTVLRWFLDLVGFGTAARGILTSGGSLANFSAIVTARRARLPEDFLRGTLYVSDQVHHSVTKAAMLAGFPQANVRSIPTDASYRMSVDGLRDAIRADRQAGMTPFLVAASAGTTNTGAVDPLVELAAVARTAGLWLHVDAAYGGFFLLTERGRALLAGIGEADSITLDPHKGLFLPYGTGCLLVRDGEALRQAHHQHADYLQDLADDTGLNFSEYSPELTRSFRGLRVWLPLKLYGAAAFAHYIDEKLDLVQYATERLKSLPGVTIVAEPQLTVVAFRRDGSDEANVQWLERTNATRRTFLSSTLLRGQVVLRIAILSFRTHGEHVDATLSALSDSL